MQKVRLATLQVGVFERVRLADGLGAHRADAEHRVRADVLGDTEVIKLELLPVLPVGDRYVSLEPGGDPAFLEDGDELFITQSAVVLEQLIGKYLLNPESSDEE